MNHYSAFCLKVFRTYASSMKNSNRMTLLIFSEAWGTSICNKITVCSRCQDCIFRPTCSCAVHRWTCILCSRPILYISSCRQ